MSSHRKITKLRNAIQEDDRMNIRKMIRELSSDELNNTFTSKLDGRTIIQEIATKPDWDFTSIVISIIVDRGADVNKQNQFGSTALHIACIHGNKRAVEELVKHGADPNMKDSSGKTPLHQLMVQQWSETETDDAVKLSIFKRLLPLINAESFVAAKKENALNRPIPRVKLLRYFEKKELFAKIFQRCLTLPVHFLTVNGMVYLLLNGPNYLATDTVPSWFLITIPLTPFDQEPAGVGVSILDVRSGTRHKLNLNNGKVIKVLREHDEMPRFEVDGHPMVGTVEQKYIHLHLVEKLHEHISSYVIEPFEDSGNFMQLQFLEGQSEDSYVNLFTTSMSNTQDCQNLLVAEFSRKETKGITTYGMDLGRLTFKDKGTLRPVQAQNTADRVFLDDDLNGKSVVRLMLERELFQFTRSLPTKKPPDYNCPCTSENSV